MENYPVTKITQENSLTEWRTVTSEDEMKIFRVHIKNFTKKKKKYAVFNFTKHHPAFVHVTYQWKFSQILTICLWKERLCNPHWTYLFIEHNFFFSYSGDMQFANESFHLSLLKKAQNSIFVYLNYIWTRGNSCINITHKNLFLTYSIPTSSSGQHNSKSIPLNWYPDKWTWSITLWKSVTIMAKC